MRSSRVQTKQACACPAACSANTSSRFLCMVSGGRRPCRISRFLSAPRRTDLSSGDVSAGMTMMRSTSDDCEKTPLAALPNRITLTREVAPLRRNCATSLRCCSTRLSIAARTLAQCLSRPDQRKPRPVCDSRLRTMIITSMESIAGSSWASAQFVIRRSPVKRSEE
jgi:hypothetical protein